MSNGDNMEEDYFRNAAAEFRGLMRSGDVAKKVMEDKSPVINNVIEVLAESIVAFAKSELDPFAPAEALNHACQALLSYRSAILMRAGGDT